jgi:hypothetical protein
MSDAQKTTGNTPVFLFLGPPRHGKTTARKILSELIQLPGASCSDVIYPLLAKHIGITEAELRAKDKNLIRESLVTFGDFLCNQRQDLGELHRSGETEDEVRARYFRCPSTLIRTLYLMGFRVIDGVRRRDELLEAKQIFTWMNVPVMTFWVHRPGVESPSDNTEVTSGDADLVLANDGDPSELKGKLVSWINSLPKNQ